jgi:hypothetical protein
MRIITPKNSMQPNKEMTTLNDYSIPNDYTKSNFSDGTKGDM